MSRISGDAAIEGVGTVKFEILDLLDSSKLLKQTELNVSYMPSNPVNLLSAIFLESRDIYYDQRSQTLIKGETNKLLAALVDQYDIKCLLNAFPPGNNDYGTKP